MAQREVSATPQPRARFPAEATAMATRSGDMGGMTTSAFAGVQPDVPGRVDTGPPAGLTRWERREGGSVAAERALCDQLGKRIMLVQLKNQKKAKAPGVARAFHAKTVLGVENARLRVLDDIPPDLCAGFVQPGAEYPTTVRLSNASGTPQADHAGDMRGMALRVRVSPDEQHDLLATNFPVSHARDPKQFVAFAEAMAGNRALGIVKLAFEVGPGEVQRMVHNVRQATGREVRSLALETYWSRGAILWGSAGPVRYLLRHAVGSPPAPEPVPADPEYLRHELQRRLAQGDVVFDLLVQRFVDEERTPIEDGAVEWTEAVSPPIAVAQLVIPKQDVGTGAAVATEAKVDQLAFNPWHTTEEFRPLGNLNRARKAVYAAGSAHRLSYRFAEAVPWRTRVLGPFNERSTSFITRYRDWYRLPLFFQLLQLSAYRDVLRRSNLIDAEVHEAPPAAGKVDDPIPEHRRTVRTFDGMYNDLSDPQMGAVGARFGRNMPRSTGPTCSIPRTRSWSAASCSRARASSRPARSTSWPPPGSSSRSTTG